MSSCEATSQARAYMYNEHVHVRYNFKFCSLPFVFVYSYVKEDIVRFKFHVECSQMCGVKSPRNSCSRLQYGNSEIVMDIAGSLSPESSPPIPGIHMCLYTLRPLKCTRLFFERYNRLPAIDLTLIVLR